MGDRNLHPSGIIIRNTLIYMKLTHIVLLALIISSCSAENIGPMGFEHGQEVEVFLDHHYGSVNDQPLLLPDRAKSEYSIHGFDEREPGYSYIVRATVHIDNNNPPIQDTAPYWLNFSEVISKEKHQSNESFEIELVQSYVPSGPVIMLQKYEDQFYFISEKISLTFTTEEVGVQLENIWRHNQEIRRAYENQKHLDLKWVAIKATVNHDPENFGKSYLVSHIDFTERK